MSDKITIRKPTAETLMSDAKPVTPPRLLRQTSIKEEVLYSQVTCEIPLEADELYEIPQPREEKRRRRECILKSQMRHKIFK